jgi:hypothetical protein
MNYGQAAAGGDGTVLAMPIGLDSGETRPRHTSLSGLAGHAAAWLGPEIGRLALIQAASATRFPSRTRLKAAVAISAQS